MSNNTDDNVVLVVNNEAAVVSLAELAGLDMSQLGERRGPDKIPEGTYEWRGKSATMEVRSIKDRNDPSKQVPRMTISFVCETLACLTVKDRSLNPAELAGLVHTERFFIEKFPQDLENVNAFLSDTGLVGKGALNTLLEQWAGTEFTAVIRESRDKKYTNMDRNSIKPLAVVAPQTTAADAAPAAAPSTDVKPTTGFGGLFRGK